MKYLVLFVLLAIGGCYASFVFLGPQPPDVRPTSLPLTHTEMVSCRECHDAATDAFLASRHHSTLFRGNAPEVLNILDGLQFDGGDGFDQSQYEAKGERIYLSSLERDEKRTVDWVFGSGNRAWTPCSLEPKGVGFRGLLELDPSYYPGDGLRVTVGHTHQGRKRTDKSAFPLGIAHSAVEAKQCFNCHGRGAEVDAAGTLRLDYFEPLLGCDNCHPSSRTHLLDEGATTAGIATKGDEPRFEIEMCGVCHRSKSDLRRTDLDRTKVNHVRFAPAGLQMSNCFQGGQSGLRCTTCHDAHHADEPVEVRQLSHNSCADCHGDVAVDACSELARLETSSDELIEGRSDCLSCHMPEVEFLEGVRFTDHWIRARDETDPPISASE